MTKASNAKKINLFVILLGFIFVLMGQTWVSVLNAEQTYLLSEARSDEAKLLKVEDRLEEIFNTLNNPEYAHTAAMSEGYSIVLKPKETLTVDSFTPWGTNGDDAGSDYLIDENTNRFIQTYEELLPVRDKTYFKPISESLKENGLAFPVETFDAAANGFKSAIETMGEGFGGGGFPEDNVNPAAGENTETVDTTLNASSTDAGSDVADTETEGMEISIEDVEPKFGGDLPAPVTH